jgi:hypothetical protein
MNAPQTAEDLNEKYDPMSRDELIAECERLRERCKWFEGYVKVCDNEIGRARGVLPTAGPNRCEHGVWAGDVCYQCDQMESKHSTRGD